jgi:hypothetical protein
MNAASKGSMPGTIALIGDVHRDGPDSYGFSFCVGQPGVGEPGSEWVSASMRELADALRDAMRLSLSDHCDAVTTYDEPETMLAAIETMWPETAAKVARIRQGMGWAAAEEGHA